MDDPDALLPVESAGNVAGIPPRTLRSWVRSGKLPATEGQRGKLVRLGDVLAIAEVTGRLPANRRQPAGNLALEFDPARSAGNVPSAAYEASSSAPTEGGMPATLPAMIEAQRASLEAIRDEWIRPLVDDLRAAERTIGRVEAERDHLAQERDELRAEVERFRAATEAPVAAPAPPESPPPSSSGGGLLGWLRRLLGG